jgi:hypothetical protein
MYFLTSRLPERDVADLWKLIPRKDLVDAWRDIETHAKDLAKRLTGKEAATPSRTWNLLSTARPEMILFLAVTAKQQAVEQKIKNFLTKWRQVQQRIPLPEMAELLITPQLPEYPKIARDVFMLLLDGKLRSRTETLKFLKPFAPPPPPPPPPPRRGRAAKVAAGAPAPLPPGKKGEVAGKGKGKAAAAAPPTAAPPPAPAKPDGKTKSKLDAKSAPQQKLAAQPKAEPAKSAAKPPAKPAPLKPAPKPASKPAPKPSAKKAKTKKR